MPESGTFGSVRGVLGNGHPYRDQAQIGRDQPQAHLKAGARLCEHPIHTLVSSGRVHANRIGQQPTPIRSISA
jgi:hypothetical protein